MQWLVKCKDKTIAQHYWSDNTLFISYLNFIRPWRSCWFFQIESVYKDQIFRFQLEYQNACQFIVPKFVRINWQKQLNSK